MRDYITLGSTPSDEDCAQVGTPSYRTDALQECRRFVAQLEQQFPALPDGVYFSTKSFPHDFGTYYEVVVNYDDDDIAQVDAAFDVENNLPTNWTQS